MHNGFPPTKHTEKVQVLKLTISTKLSFQKILSKRIQEKKSKMKYRQESEVGVDIKVVAELIDSMDLPQSPKVNVGQLKSLHEPKIQY